MKVFINGETREVEGGLNLRELLGKFDLPSERVAVELNKQVVRRKDWENTEINDADRIEIVHFVGGG
jgi:sulfur carrier protein